MTPATLVSALPDYLELIPEELSLRVYRHAIDSQLGPVHCWSYVSDGLRRFDQKEIVFTLRREPHENERDFPADPVDYFLLLYRQAREGKLVEAGGYSRFARKDGFLGVAGPVGMIYVNAPPLRGVNYPDRALSAIQVTSEELEVVRAQGSYRVLSLLGFRNGFFPYPLWSDRERNSLITPKDNKKSLLGNIPLATVPGLMLRRQRNQVHMHLHERGWPFLQKRLEQVPAQMPFALLTDPDPEAKARLVWRPGMMVETYGPDEKADAMLTGGFVAFSIMPQVDEGAHVCEDGFAVRLKPASWERLRECLTSGESLVINPQSKGMRFVFGLGEDVDAVIEAGSMFFQAEPELMARVKRDDLAMYNRKVSAVVEDHFADLPTTGGQALTLVCAVRSGYQARFWVECRPDELPAGSHSLLYRRLGAIKPPPVRAPIAWSLRFELWGGTGNPSHFVHMPGEWQVAYAPHETPVVPDDILRRVWPAEV